MIAESISEPAEFLNLHSLHDVWLEKISVDFENQSVKLEFHDLNWNYDGSSEYVKRPCSVIFSGISGLFIDVMDIEGVRIDSNKASVFGNLIILDIFLNLGGGNVSWTKKRSSISLIFESMNIVDN